MMTLSELSDSSLIVDLQDDCSAEQLEALDAQLELLRRLRQGALIPFRRAFTRARTAGLLSTVYVDSLRAGASESVASFLAGAGVDLPTPQPDIGEVWLALTVHDGSRTMILPRRIRCRVGRSQEVAVGRIRPWSTGLEKVVSIVGQQVSLGLRDAAKDWWRNSVRYSLHESSGSEAQAQEVVSVDRSYELAAACALVSESFGVPWEGGTLVMAMVRGDGTVEPYSNDLMRAKLEGILPNFPSVSSVIVAGAHVDLARSMLPSGVEVIGIEDTVELGHVLGVAAAEFRGRRRESRIRTLIRGAHSEPSKPLADKRDVARWHSACVVGGVLAIAAVLLTAIRLERSPVDVGEIVHVSVLFVGWCFVYACMNRLAKLLGRSAHRDVVSLRLLGWYLLWCWSVYGFMGWISALGFPYSEVPMLAFLALACLLPGRGLGRGYAAATEVYFARTLACYAILFVVYPESTGQFLAMCICLLMLLGYGGYGRVFGPTMHQGIARARRTIVALWLLSGILFYLVLADTDPDYVVPLRYEIARFTERDTIFPRWMMTVVAFLACIVVALPCVRALGRTRAIPTRNIGGVSPN